MRGTRARVGAGAIWQRDAAERLMVSGVRPSPRSMSIGVFLLLLVAYLWRAPNYHYFLTNTDHASNIGLGGLIARGGHFPFVDHYHFYGPLAALVSAFGMWVHDSLVSEVLICSLGWAAAIALIQLLVARHSNLTTSLVFSLAAFLLTPRFYKYYYWLMPALGLFLVEAIHRGGARTRSSWVLVAGFATGAAALFRWDLGAVLLCLLALSTSVPNLVRLTRLPLLALSIRYLAGLALPMVAWLTALWTLGGFGAIRDYFVASVDGTRGYIAKHPSDLFWSFRFEEPLSMVSLTVVSYWLYPAICVAGLTCGALALRCSHPRERGDFAFLAATSLLAIGVSPQFYQAPRPDHLLQAALPLYATAALLIHHLLEAGRISKHRSRAKPWLRAFAVLLLAVLGVVGSRIGQAAGAGLSPMRHDVILKYRKLAGGIRSELNDEYWASVVRRIRRLTSPRDRILVFGNAAQFYYFTDRRMAGIFHNYTGVYASSQEWGRRNLEALERNPPKLIYLRERDDFFTDPPSRSLVRRYYPDVFDFVTEHYREMAYRENSQLILVRSDEWPASEDSKASDDSLAAH